MPASAKARISAAAAAGVSSGAFTSIEQPAARAAPTLRTTWLIGKFHGVKAATGPTGSLITIWRMVMALREGTMRPYTRKPSSANHSMMSAAARVSPFASASGLPCSWVRSGAISPARSRMSAAALRMILLRSAGSISRQTSKPFCAACSALSRSGRLACATRPISLPVAGFSTGNVLPSAGCCHWPLMKSCVSTYPMVVPRGVAAQEKLARCYAVLLHIQQLDFENQRRIRRNHPAGAPRAIAELGRDDEQALASDLHAGHALVPALDHPAASQGKRERPAPARAVELLSALVLRRRIMQPAGVVHLDGIPGNGFLALADHRIGLHQPGGACRSRH